MPLHAVQNDLPSEPESGTDLQDVATRRLSPARLDSGARVARHLSLAIAATSSQTAAARAIGVSRSLVERWADSEHPAAITLRDVELLPRDTRRALLTSLLAATEAPASSRENMRSHVGHVAVALGVLASTTEEALADGVVSWNERAELQRALVRIERAVERARVDLSVTDESEDGCES